MKRLLPFLAFTALACATQSFEENRGQANSRIQFLASTPDASVLFTRNGVEFLASSPSGKLETLGLTFAGAAPLRWHGTAPRPQTYHYLLPGIAPSAGRDVHRYERITAASVYPGIDVVFYFEHGKLEYDFIVSPSADASRIILEFDAPGTLSHTPEGAFRTTVAGQPWHQRTPVVYQTRADQRRRVASHWQRTSAHRYQFQTAAYDKSRPLIVDPVLEFATYLGGEADDEITASGDGWVGGNTRSNLFDGLNGKPRKGRDIFFRLTSSASTFRGNSSQLTDQVYLFGGSGDDSLAGASIFFGNNSVSFAFGGTTSSTDLPGPVDSNQYNGGASDTFICTHSVGVPPSTLIGTPYYLYFGGSGADTMAAFQVVTRGALIAGTTDSPDLPVFKAIQPAHGGGKDAFYAVVPFEPFAKPPLASYFGGSGDDEALNVNYIPSSSEVWIVGETRSESIPGLPGVVSGLSDAFALRIGPIYDTPGLFKDDIPLVAAHRVGASGEERIRFVSATSLQTLLAGETSSPDFPTLDSAQSTHTGGTDVFILRLASDGQIISSALWGGSGDESVRGFQTYSGSSEVLIAGDSSSSDLPMRDPQQPQLRGGRDAFLAWLTMGGQLLQSTYHGGSGDDFTTSMYTVASSRIRLSGHTDSSDLPERSSWQPGSAGGRDAWLADFSIPAFIAPEWVWVAPGIQTRILISTLQPIGSRIVTLRVSDPARAAFRVGSRLLSEVTIDSRLDNALEGLASEGETSVTISAPGFASRTVRVRLGKPVMRFSGADSLSIGIFDEGPRIQVVPDVVDPSTGRLGLQNSSNYSALDFGNPIIDVADPSIATYSLFGLRPQGIGSTTVTAKGKFPFFPETGLPVNVGPGRFAPQRDPAWLTPVTPSTVELRPYLGQSVFGNFKVEVENPRIAQVIFVNGPPSSAIDVVLPPNSNSRTLSLLLWPGGETGATRLKISSSFLTEDTYVPVEVRPAVLNLAFERPSGIVSTAAQLLPGESIAVRPRLGIEGVTQAFVPSPNPPLQIFLQSTNPDVASLPAPILRYDLSSTTSVKANSLGTASLIVGTSNPLVKIGAPPSIEVRNRIPSPVQLANYTVGYRLCTPFNVQAPYFKSDTAIVEISVDDPSLAGVATSIAGPPAPRLSVPYSEARNLYLFGLANSGATSVRIRVTGYEEVVSRVRLTPSGFAFREVRRTVEVGTGAIPVAPSAYALDPVTLEPLEAMAVPPSVNAELRLESDSPDLTLSAATCRPGSSTCNITAAATQAGAYTVSLSPVEGFTTPASWQRLSLRVLRAGLTPPTFSAVRDCVTSGVISNPSNQPTAPRRQFTITSLDPDLLRFSKRLDQEGTPSISAQVTEQFYLHGIATGPARYRIEGPEIDTIEASVFVQDRRILISAPTNNTVLLTAPSNYNVRLVGAGGPVAFGLVPTAGTRPGIPPVQFDIKVEDTSVARITPTSTANSFSNGKSSLDFTINGLKAGATRLIVQAPDFNTESSDILVRPARLVTSRSLIVGWNSKARYSIQLESSAAAPRDNVPFTVRSLDPSRLLLQSPQGNIPGTETLTGIWPAGQSAVDISLHALASTGSADFEVSLSGYEAATGRAYFTPLVLGFDRQSGPQQFTRGGEQTWRPTIAGAPRADLAGLANVSPAGFEGWRPGFDTSTLTFSVDVDDPSVLDVKPLTNISLDPPAIVVRAIKTGTAKVTLNPPPGFADSPTLPREQRVLVVDPPLSLSCDAQTLPYESVRPCTLTRGTLSDSPITIRSASASSLLLSETATQSGAPEITLRTRNTSYRFFIHGRASSGFTTMTASSPDYASSDFNVIHAQSVFLFTPFQVTTQPRPLTLNQTTTLPIGFCAAADQNPAYCSTSSLRPDATPVTVVVRVGDPTVLSAPASVTFMPGDSRKEITIKGLKPGLTTIELGVPAGFAPSSAAPLQFKVN